MRWYSLKQLASKLGQWADRLSQYPVSEPHRFGSETLPWLHLKTSNGITHAGWSDSRSADGNDATTLCGLTLHHCDLQWCRHPNRHRTRTFSRLIPSEVAETDCMACVVASLGLENQ